MSHEGRPAGPVIDQSERVLREDGGMNEAVLEERYGLGAIEAQQEITFGSYTGTVAQMLDDEHCPVGGMIANAYQQKGLEGVKEQFENIRAMDPNFTLEISLATQEREELKKN